MPYVKTPQNESFPPWTWSEAPLLTSSSHHEPNPEIRNIMITGGAGFIASWVARHLATTYGGHYNIVSFDKLDYCASLNNTNQLNHLENFSFYHGDIMKADEVLDCLRKHKIDTVMHFAAQSHVDLSFGNSYDFTYANVYGTHVLLECMKTYGIKKFIHVSTDEVYGEVKDGADDLLKDAILAPTNPYAASKAAAEMMVHAYYKSFKLPVIIVRSNNVYGPHQFPEKVIPKFSLMLQRGLRLPLHGSGDNTRRYLYAGDAADAFDTILHKGEIGHIYNVDSHDEVSTIDLCAHLLRLFGLPNPQPKISTSMLFTLKIAPSTTIAMPSMETSCVNWVGSRRLASMEVYAPPCSGIRGLARPGGATSKADYSPSLSLSRLRCK
ncbi:NAD(P)-binding protein, partial [Aureobasidium melanogenum]